MQSWSAKDPQDRVDYQFDWSERLEPGETILTSEILIADSLTLAVDSDSVAGGLTTFWVTGGIEGEVAKVTNRINTSEGRQYDATARLRIRSS